MLARLRYQRSCGRLDGAGERRLAAALLGGYAESGSLPDAHALRLGRGAMSVMDVTRATIA